jgi:PAB-dependent poly(A)-specific ribonuclease subunit 2
VPTTAFAHGAGAANSAQPLCVALATPELLVLNGLTGAVLRRAPTPSRTEHLLHAHAVLLSGAADGQLRAHDPRTGMRREGGAEAAAHAHVAGVRGLAVAGNYACTIGWGLRSVPAHSSGSAHTDPTAQALAAVPGPDGEGV